MIMADVLKIALLIVATMMVFISHWLVGAGLFPCLINTASDHYGRPLKLTFVGLAVVAPVLAVGLLIASLPSPVMKIAGGSLIALPVMVGLVGSAGLCQRIGMGLKSPLDEQQPWRRVLRGGVPLVFTFLLPFVGWFFLTGWTIVSGCGAVVLAVVQTRKCETPAPAPVEGKTATA
jgi:hypothetical protein